MGTSVMVTSGKGGTGKTALTAGVASCLAALGRRVLCIDVDVGLRNLDIALGMSDRAVMDFSDVMEHRCPLLTAAAEHPKIRGLFLLTAPLSLINLDLKGFRDVIDEARDYYDFIFLDSPAGLGDGACHVHEEFSLERLLELRRQHPAAKVVVHPECRDYIVAVADYVGSTAGILAYCGSSEASEFIVVTEAGILSEMRRRYPDKVFIPAPPDDETCGCNNCKYMKMVTLENIAAALENLAPEIVLDEATRLAAERSIRNMIAIR